MFVQRRDLNAHQNLMRTRWRRLLDVDDEDHLCGVAELFNLDGAHINYFGEDAARATARRIFVRPNAGSRVAVRHRCGCKPLASRRDVLKYAAAAPVALGL